MILPATKLLAMSTRFVVLPLLLAAAADGIKLKTIRKTKHCSKRANATLLPFDCYMNSGGEYEGLLDKTKSGRKCKNWLDEGSYASSTKGIGNHHYCRNPNGAKEKPWCFTMDPATEWEFCSVPECKAEDAAPEGWTAPEGAKSAAAEEEGPCLYEAPDDPGYTTWKEGRACEDKKGDKSWLISNKKVAADDADGCMTKCEMMPGTEYFTFFGEADDDGNNCGCYRECVLVSPSMTVNSPTAFRVK